MPLDARSTAILAQVLKSDTYITVRHLEEVFNVSRRTIYYDFEKINGWLRENRLPKIDTSRAKGFCIDEETRQAIYQKIKQMKEWHYEYTQKEREAWLIVFILLSYSPLHLDDLMDLLRVSRNTVLKDLRNLSRNLKNYNLILKAGKSSGYCVNGSEKDKRRGLLYYLSQVISKSNWDYLIRDIQLCLHSYKKIRGRGNDGKVLIRQHLNAIRISISDMEKYLKIRFVDSMKYSMCFAFYSFGIRVHFGNNVKMDETELGVLKKSREFKAARYVCEVLEDLLGIFMSEEEQAFISLYLLGTKLEQDSILSHDENIMSNLREATGRMIEEFEKYACITFAEKDRLKKNLLLHIKPAYYRVKYGLEVDNPLAETIMNKYNEVFAITKKVMHHFTNLTGKEPGENEIAYMAIHFAGWMKRTQDIIKKFKKIYVVCAAGVGISRILQNQLEELFSAANVMIEVVTVENYENMDNIEADMIISTTNISRKDRPVYIVNPILTHCEKLKLLKKVYSLFPHFQSAENSVEILMNIISSNATIHNEKLLRKRLKQFLYKHEIIVEERYTMLKDLITKNRIQLVESIRSWEEAIRIASQPLLYEKCIENSYVDAMIENVKKLGPYIVLAPNIAIAHARPEDGVNRLSMSFLKLNHPVAFSEKQQHQVNLLFILAAEDNVKHLKALSQFSKMMSVPSSKERLIASRCEEDVLELIAQYSSN